MTLCVVLVPLMCFGGAGASTSTYLRSSITTMNWAGGVVTLSAHGGPANAKCLVTSSPALVISSREWTCGLGVHRSMMRLPSNESPRPMHYRFTMNPGDVSIEVTVKSSEYGGGLSVTRQPSNAAISADESERYVTTTLRARSSGSPNPHVQWYSSTVSGHWNAVKGATRRTLVVSAATLADFVVQYEATFSNKGNSVTTRPATIYEVTYGQKWAGYVDVASSDRKFSSVSGSWRVPTATCRAATTEESTWVGIDGQTNQTVEQAGTYDDCQDGEPSYWAFYELWGYASLKGGGLAALLPASRDPVAPGDVVSAKVTLAAGKWVFTITDVTAGWHSSIPVAQPTPSPAQTSAEWVVEAPQICDPACTTAALTRVSPETFTKASATESGIVGTISTWPTLAMAIRNSETPLDEVGALNRAGNSFTVTATSNDK